MLLHLFLPAPITMGCRFRASDSKTYDIESFRDYISEESAPVVGLNAMLNAPAVMSTTAAAVVARAASANKVTLDIFN